MSHRDQTQQQSCMPIAKQHNNIMQVNRTQQKWIKLIFRNECQGILVHNMIGLSIMCNAQKMYVLTSTLWKIFSSFQLHLNYNSQHLSKGKAGKMTFHPSMTQDAPVLIMLHIWIVYYMWHTIKFYLQLHAGCQWEISQSATTFCGYPSNAGYWTKYS